MMNDGTKLETPITIRFEPDTGFISISHDGVLTEDMAKMIVAEYEKHSRDGSPVFMIGDQRRGTTMTPGARKTFVNAKMRGDLYYVGFGASLTFRVAAGLLTRAFSMAMPVHTALFATEPEARVWLAEKKKLHVGKKGGS
jgi:hypothetical protein